MRQTSVVVRIRGQQHKCRRGGVRELLDTNNAFFLLIEFLLADARRQSALQKRGIKHREREHGTFRTRWFYKSLKRRKTAAAHFCFVVTL